MNGSYGGICFEFEQKTKETLISYFQVAPKVLKIFYN